MHTRTRTAVTAYCNALVKTYGLGNVDDLKNFTLTEISASKFQDAVQKSDAFLTRISMLPSIEASGTVFTIDIPETLAGRVDTDSDERSGTNIGAKDKRKYECKRTNFDAKLKYETIDQMAIFPNFKQLVSTAINQRIALDRLLIGFNGTSCSATPNRAQNKLLQDVNTGWFHDLKTSKAENHINTATLGATGNYKNLDQAVADLMALIPEEHRNGLCVLVGSELVAEYDSDTYSKFGSQPSEKVVFEKMSKRFGNLEAITPSGFPARAIMIVNPKNLILYYQISSLRKTIIDRPEKDAFFHLTQVSECYRIGTVEACAAIGELTVATPA